jgi:starvation-inducible DNA-binding protein
VRRGTGCLFVSASSCERSEWFGSSEVGRCPIEIESRRNPFRFLRSEQASQVIIYMQSKTKSGITGKTRVSLTKILDHVLKEEVFLSATMREYRSNVSGPNLYSLRRLFDEQRRQLDYWLDRVIERTKSIGGAKKASKVKAMKSEPEVRVSAGVPAGSMIGDLLSRHERMARRLRDDIERLPDKPTAELLLQLVEFHETTAWMLRVVHSGPDSDPLLA